MRNCNITCRYRLLSIAVACRSWSSVRVLLREEDAGCVGEDDAAAAAAAAAAIGDVNLLAQSLLTLRSMKSSSSSRSYTSDASASDCDVNGLQQPLMYLACSSGCSGAVDCVRLLCALCGPSAALAALQHTNRSGRGKLQSLTTPAPPPPSPLTPHPLTSLPPQAALTLRLPLAMQAQPLTLQPQNPYAAHVTTAKPLC